MLFSLFWASALMQNTKITRDIPEVSARRLPHKSLVLTATTVRVGIDFTGMSDPQVAVRSRLGPFFAGGTSVMDLHSHLSSSETGHTIDCAAKVESCK